MIIKIFTGKIRIIEPDGKISPYEKFIITRNPDKSKTLRTVTKSPLGDLLRDVNQMISEDWHDIEAMGRLFYKDVNMGTITRRIIGDTLHSHIWNKNGYTDKKEFDAPHNMIIGLHPITHDAWKMNLIDTSHNNEQNMLVHTVSTTWNGRTLTHGEKLLSTVTYEGEEMLKLPAGEFMCEKFLWKSPFDKLLAVWRMGEARVLAKMHVLEGGKSGTIYELEQYDEE